MLLDSALQAPHTEQPVCSMITACAATDRQETVRQLKLTDPVVKLTQDWLA